MPPVNKSIYLDVETTGLYAYRHSITQLAAMMYLDGKLVETLDYRMKPLEGREVEQKALEVQNRTLEEIMGYDNPYDTKVYFTNKLKLYVDQYNKKDKFFLYVYNHPFDTDFVNNWFKTCKDNYFFAYFFNPVIDVSVLAGEFIAAKGHRQQMLDMKLLTVAEYFGVAEPNAHDALVDVRMTKAIHDEIKKMTRLDLNFKSDRENKSNETVRNS